MADVKPKKHLGQHFLRDLNIARKIAELVQFPGPGRKVLEIGPGTGVLTQFLLELPDADVRVAEIDVESVAYLKQHFPALEGRIIEGDVLQMDLAKLYDQPFSIAGNFPYNISSQILFQVLDHRNLVAEVVCMLQREVAQRIASGPGNKDYGILSVLLQTFYDIKYCFTVDEHVFNPPPKVKSGVISLVRNNTVDLPCSTRLFFMVVKAGFNQRRKTLRNALKSLGIPESLNELPVLEKRAEQLHYTQFLDLCTQIEQARKQP